MLKWCVHHGGRFGENQGFVSWWKERAGWGGEGRGISWEKEGFLVPTGCFRADILGAVLPSVCLCVDLELLFDNNWTISFIFATYT